MYTRTIKEITGTERDVNWNGIQSLRLLLEKDNMGFSFSKTVIKPHKKHNWHYKHHLEACYCVSGRGYLISKETGEKFEYEPETIYILDKNDDHYFYAEEETYLVSVFNPPLTGLETHNKETNIYEMKSNKSPVYSIRRIHIDKITPNDYNPNSVAPPEMKLLETSILDDGYTMPIVCYYNEEKDIYEIVDGFHRYSAMKNNKEIYDREDGHLPVSVINKPIEERMASTIRHNRARGTHDIQLESAMVKELVESGKGDRWIAQKLGFSVDKVLRLKQITGLASLFKDKEFSKSWE